ncbi:hypothetical protein TW95_gp1418 [Pandoravirus inopinatum]|uniref:Uncharacterized protein n=1 Tax=Pandoravirus inopinatum TaxID=1605721 RepID=A0A0B5JEH1_9VIRU|nr:hypothetical protein TW95_gp1418 [Pandoravirus inopinatum]AJF98152.1 hypothetical protein [Pandoravirus inopinatum]
MALVLCLGHRAHRPLFFLGGPVDHNQRPFFPFSCLAQQKNENEKKTKRMPSEGGGAQKKGIISGGRVDARVACQRSVKSARVHAKVDKKEERDSEGAGNRCSRTARRRVAMLPVEAPCAPRERSLGKRNPVVVVPQKKPLPDALTGRRRLLGPLFLTSNKESSLGVVLTITQKKERNF